ncbi:unnamed protein product [Rotaria sp. Silwood1]|nr:unnamed protein product [Rotaria sp. Silwood1]
MFMSYIDEKARREVKAEFNRQRIAQDAKKLALAALLRRLAIGSTNTNQFDEKLKATVDNQKEKGHIPIITGDIREPSALLIPDGNIRITRVESGSVIVIGYVMPPYGKNVIEGLNGNARDSAARIEAVRQSCSSYNGQVESITLGDFGLSIDHKLMDPAWNRKYLWSPEDPEKGEYWKRSLNRGGRPYFCPSGAITSVCIEEIALTDLTDLATSPRDEAREASSVSQTMPLVNPLNSWKRYGVKVAENDKEFDARWGNWYIAYHGTKSEYATNILTSGLRMSTTGCFYEKGVPRVYLSPSIEYCAHPRYAKPWIKTDENGKIRWFQLVFQCRVNPDSIKKIQYETLINDKYKNSVTVDPNFDNNELEWIIPGKEGVYYIKDDIICYGIMMRICDVDPKYLPASKWWQYTFRD